MDWMEFTEPATSMAQGGGPEMCLTLLPACRSDSCVVILRYVGH